MSTLVFSSHDVGGAGGVVPPASDVFLPRPPMEPSGQPLPIGPWTPMSKMFDMSML